MYFVCLFLGASPMIFNRFPLISFWGDKISEAFRNSNEKYSVLVQRKDDDVITN